MQPGKAFYRSSSCMTFAKHQWNSPAGRNTQSCSMSKPNVSYVTHAVDSFLASPRQLQTKAALRPVRYETGSFLTGHFVAYVVRGEGNQFSLRLYDSVATRTQWRISQLSSLMITSNLSVAFVWTRHLCWIFESIYRESQWKFWGWWMKVVFKCLYSGKRLTISDPKCINDSLSTVFFLSSPSVGEMLSGATNKFILDSCKRILARE